MKKNTLILLIGAVLGIFAYRYYFVNSPGVKSPVRHVIATYTGPDIVYMGLITKGGDIIEGTLSSDGSLEYTMWGNGIVASSQTFNIPSVNLTNIHTGIN